MKKIVRLNESQLTNMIKRVISEISTASSPQKVAGGLCRDPYYTVTYNSSSGEPTYNCNSSNGWGVDQASTQTNGILTCKCFKGGKGGK